MKIYYPGVAAFDNLLIAVDEFHHVSASPDNKLGLKFTQIGNPLGIPQVDRQAVMGKAKSFNIR